MFPPATSNRLLLHTPKDHPKVCLKETEPRDTGGGDMHSSTSSGRQGNAVREIWFGVPQSKFDFGFITLLSRS